MLALINHTNHPSSKWSEKQKEGFDKIIDLPFPNISPTASDNEVWEIVKWRIVPLSHEPQKRTN